MKYQIILSRIAAMVALLMACGVTAVSAQPGTSEEQRFPDVLSAKVRTMGDNSFNFDVTISSPYDTASRYADGFHVVSPSGSVLGERKLWHDHQAEQPFTRDLYSVKISPEIKEVVIVARDQKYGYGGKSIQVGLPDR
ncbi:MAG: hypothetical protein WA632_08130 [Gallionella sp.]